MAESPNRPKRVLWLGLGLFVSGCIIFFSPIRWQLVRLIWKEPQYRNMPLSYWRERIIDDVEARKGEKGPFEILNRLIWKGKDDAAIPEGDPDAVPILLELLIDEDPRVRAGAAYELSFRPTNEGVITALVDRIRDVDSKVRIESINSLRRLGPSAKIAVPVLLRAIDDPDESVRESAALALCAVDLQTAKSHERVLRQLLGIPEDLPGIHYPFPPP